ncbi:glucan biosynthesis protein, partial [Polaromonas sp.]|uniref:glucan biosynthesis protein n=1 Tax=Polaromonas sp. TaxID=1869339 RepID=UPI00286B21A0
MPAFFSAFCVALPRPGAAAAHKAYAALFSAVLLALTSVPAHAFNLDDVVELARQRAQTPFKAAPSAIPPELAKLDYDALRDIRFKPGNNLWRSDKLPFESNFFHTGPRSDPVRLHEITADGVKPLPYNAGNFSFGNNKLNPEKWGDLGYGGVRAFSPLNAPGVKDELVVFQGASYFRALGMGQRYGLSARGLAVDTVGVSQEEFPRFTDFWLEKPAPDAKRLTVYALLDSQRMTGAYRFDITPGEQTTTEVQA